MSIIKNYTAFINENTEGGKKVFNLYHVKALSPSDNEMVLSDKSGNTFYIYKKEEDSDIWVLYNTDTSSGKIKPTTSHRMSKIIVNILDSTNENKDGYAAQRKIGRDIERKLKNEKSAEKSNAKKNKVNNESKIIQKNKKTTEREHAHIDLYFDDVYIGYIIKNDSTLAVKDENWNFVSKHNSLKSTYDKTKDALIDKINKACYDNNIKPNV